MAIAQGAVWEVRSLGAATNGGGFVPGGGGTDYSQQNAAQYGFTDLATTSGTTNPAVVTSASHNFVAADVGNIINISAGTNWTKGFYQIVSCAGNAATLDKACGTSATLTAGTFAVGGALKLAGIAYPDATWSAAIAAGNTVWYKADGTHTSYQLNYGAGTSTVPVLISGYQTSRGDNPAGTNRPLIDLGIGYTHFIGANTVVKNLSLYISSTGSTSNRIFSCTNNNVFINCRAINDTTDAGQGCWITGSNVTLIDCEAVCYRGYGVDTSGAVALVGCYIHDCDVGLHQTGANGAFHLDNCILEGCVTAAIQYTAANTVKQVINNCTLYGAENKLGIGVSAVSGVPDVAIMNTIVYGFVTGISFADAAMLGYDNFNTYFNNTADVSNWIKGASTVATNPGFTSMGQYTGTTATTSGSVLTDGAAAFTNVVNNQDYVYIKSGTGVTAGIYKITGHTATTLTLEEAPGTNATANKVYQVTTGHNFAVSSAMQALGFGGFQLALSTGYMDIGAVQRKERLSVDPGIANVRNGTAYTINDASLTGTYTAGAGGSFTFLE